MFETILLILIAALGVLAVMISRQPAQFEISRTVSIAAPVEAVFPHVNDLHQWHEWSPWAKLDPNAAEDFGGPQQGAGAFMHWNGNRDVGEGTMTITESTANRKIGLRLDFVKPFKAVSTAEFTFVPGDGTTQVTWRMNGENNFIGKAISLFMDCEKMVGGQFESGLQNLAAVSKA